MDVLLVEDNDDIREVVTEALEEAGLTLAGEANPHRALALVKAPDSPVVLVTDIDLGCDMDGFSLATAARLLLPALCVVYISGRPYNFARRQLLPTDRFVPKPFTFVDLLRAIRELTRLDVHLATSAALGVDNDHDFP